MREAIAERAPGVDGEQVTTLARIAAGRLDRAERLLDPAAAQRRESLLAVARAVYLDSAFDAADGAGTLLDAIAARGDGGEGAGGGEVAALELPAAKPSSVSGGRSAAPSATSCSPSSRSSSAWYRDLVVLAAGAEPAVVHVDRLADLREDATRERLQAAEVACEIVRAAWREAEELQLSVPLALEALL